MGATRSTAARNKPSNKGGLGPRLSRIVPTSTRFASELLPISKEISTKSGKADNRISFQNTAPNAKRVWKKLRLRPNRFAKRTRNRRSLRMIRIGKKTARLSAGLLGWQSLIGVVIRVGEVNDCSCPSCVSTNACYMKNLYTPYSNPFELNPHSNV